MSPKLQELLFDFIFKMCQNYTTFLQTDFELSSTEVRRINAIKVAHFCRSVLANISLSVHFRSYVAYLTRDYYDRDKVVG